MFCACLPAGVNDGITISAMKPNIAGRSHALNHSFSDKFLIEFINYIYSMLLVGLRVHTATQQPGRKRRPHFCHTGKINPRFDLTAALPDGLKR